MRMLADEVMIAQVKKGRWPGGPVTFIESKNVINGGASQREADRLYCKEYGIERSPSRRGSRNGAIMRETSQRRNGSHMGRSTSMRSGMSKGGHSPTPGYDWVARDGYGPPPQR